MRLLPILPRVPRILALLLALAICLNGKAAPTTDLLSWPAPTPNARPWTRWWWLGSAVDEANLGRILQEFRDAGLGGVEICPIYGAHGYENRVVDYLSPRWMELLAATTRDAARLGLGVDLTTGTGWPMGGPWIDQQHSSTAAILRKSPRPGGGTDYTIVPRSGIQKVKRAAPGDEGLVVDPFSAAAMDLFLSRFDRAFQGYAGAPPRAEFHDSFEYWMASWTNDFFAEFRQRRGYDLRAQLPAFFGEGEADTAARVRYDYRVTLGELHETFVERWTKWSHDHGSLTREQAHGAPANLEDLYATSDIPETEGRFLGSEEALMPVLKIASSAAHIAGHPLASAETFTWLGEHYRVSLAQLKPTVDFFFLAGINHIFFHGIPYSPADVPWPGWLFYASVNLGPNGGLWHDLPGFNAYATRCQSILQSGRPANDVLLYFPMADFWQIPQERLAGRPTDDRSIFSGLQVRAEELVGDAPVPAKLFTLDGAWIEGTPFQEAALALLRLGYSYDQVTDRYLAQATVAHGRVLLGGNGYRAIVLPSSRLMPVATLDNLVKLQREGATIIVQGKPPADVPGLDQLAQRRQLFRQLLGSFRPQSGGDLDAMLRRAGIAREAMVDWGLSTIRRRREDGWDYFIVNSSQQAVNGWVPLATPARSAVLLDPLSATPGGLAAVRAAATGRAEIFLQLLPGESRIVRTSAGTLAGPNWAYAASGGGETRTLTGRWQVHFLEGGPVLPQDYSTATLASWTERDDPEAKRFAGTARYRTEFDFSAGGAADWRLDLGRVADSARVRVNGREVAILWCPPFAVPVGEFLRPGKNVLEIDVTNVAANRIADLDRRHVNWKIFYEINFVNLRPGHRDYQPFDASGWPERDSGLLGPVRLQPQRLMNPTRDP